MKNRNLMAFRLLLFMVVLSISSFGIAQVGGWNPELKKEAKEALGEMLKTMPQLSTFKEKAYGYAVFPKITKAGLGIGGAAGNGVVYKDGTVVGSAKLKQASFGLQAGGQQYSEVIFFEDKVAFDHFTNGNLKFDAQASAVAIEEGAAINVAYHEGVAVFTKVKGGLMVEASIGGQHFSYDPIE